MTPSALAFLSLWRRPLSSLMAILSIGFALGLGGWLLNFHSAVFSSLDRREAGIEYILGPKSNGLSILLNGLFLAGRDDDIIDYFVMGTIKEKVKPPLMIPLAHFADSEGIPVIGTDDSFLHRPDSSSPPKLAKGRWFGAQSADVVLGSEAARKMGVKVGGTFAAKSILSSATGIPLWMAKMEVVGILEPSGFPRDRGIYTDIRHAWRYHQSAIGKGLLRMVKDGRGVTSFLVGLDSKDPDMAKRLHEIVHVASNPQVVNVQEEISSLQHLLGQGKEAISGITLLLILMAASIASLLFNERFETAKRELGLLRALGYTRGQIARSILWEALFLTLPGILFGMFFERLGGLIAPLIWNPPWLQPPPWPDGVLEALWVAMLVACLLSALLPLIRLYRWNAHDALKGL
jgi:putative ABC transport system permease protein